MKRRLLSALAAVAMLTAVLGAPTTANAAAAWSIAPGCGSTTTVWGLQVRAPGYDAADIIRVTEHVQVCYNSAGYITTSSIDGDTYVTSYGWFLGFGGHANLSTYAVYNNNTPTGVRTGKRYGTDWSCIANYSFICGTSDDWQITFRAIAPAINGGHVDVNGNVTQVHWLIIDSFIGAQPNHDCFLYFNRR